MSIKCPICSTPVQLAHLSDAGTCLFCADSLRDLRRANGKAAVLIQAARDEAWEKVDTRFLELHAAAAQRAADKKKKEELAKKRRALTSVNKAQASIALARRSLLHYVERYMPTYDASWAHEDVSRRIEKFVAAVDRGESPRLILQICSRFGKQLGNQVLTLTANRGWTTHGDLKVGDFVYGIDGQPTLVEAVTPDQPSDMEVELTNGDTFITHSKHEWVVHNKCKNRWEIFETKRLYTSARGTRRKLHYDRKEGGGFHLYSLPNTPCLENDPVDLGMDPYTLGAWLGDGKTDGVIITHHASETELIDKIVANGYERTYACYNFKAGSCATAFGGKPSKMREELRAIGVFGNKHIPEEYFSASRAQRLELLAGLVDSDGTICKTSSRIQFSTCSEVLRDDYIRLLKTLGQRPYYSTVAPALSSSGIQGKKNTYIVGFQPTFDDLPTALPRKRVHRTVELKRVGIKDIRPYTGDEMGRCIQVASPYGCYLVGPNLIPTHNSLLASDAGPAWILGNHPDWKIVIASHSDELPTAFSKNIRTQLRGPDYQEVFPKGAKISADDSGAKAWTTTQGGGLRATGVGGGLLGFGANCLIIDDPIKNMEEADSPAQLEKVYDWFSSIAYSRLMPGGGILVIQQRMAHEDLVGRLETRMLEEEANIVEMRAEAAALRSKGKVSIDDERDAQYLENAANELDESIDRWDIATYPALATHDEYLEPKGNIVRVQPTMEAKSDWRLLRRAGEAIHPKRYNRSYYLKIKRANPRRFAAMYQLTPQVDDGEYFSKASFQRYKLGKYPNLETCIVFAAWDLAIGTKQTNDHTVGIAGCIDPKAQLWLLDRIRGRFGDIREISDMIIDMHTKWNCSQTGIERTHVEMAMGPILKTRMRERGLYINLAEGKEALKPISDKRVRARPLQNLCQSNRVFVPEGEDWDDYISLMTRFGSTTIDDDVDATAWLAILATRHAPPRDPAEDRKNRKPDSWLDDYIAETMSDSGNYMAS